jgi:hypothetical protein
VLRLAVFICGVLLAATALAQPFDPSLFDSPVDGLRTRDGTMRIYAVKPGVDFAYIRPDNSRYFNFLWKDYRQLGRQLSTPRALRTLGAVVVCSGALVSADQAIIDRAQKWGDQWSLKHTNKQKALISTELAIGGQKIGLPLNFPQDLESGMYFLGDGIVHSSIAVGLWGFGKVSGDQRAVQAGAQCIESILCTGVMIQVLKHSFGRESPQAATVDGGKWRILPNPADYQRHVPNFDAMPSGHIATAMTTVTVIADNYPDKKWIRPLGYSLMGVLMYAMLNNGVHWASDYPLGIAIGYSFAKIIDARSRTIISRGGQSELQHGLAQTTVLPYLSGDRYGLRLGYNF